MEKSNGSRKFSPVLTSLWETGRVDMPSGGHRQVVANIDRDNCNALYDLVVREQPETVVEIGMAYGISTLVILSALSQNEHGKIISIDPYFGWPTGMEVAKHQISMAGFADMHTHLQEPSQIALPRLWQQQDFQTQFVYIDGYHNVEYVMTDCFYADKLLPAGGIMGFNDCGWRAVFKVLKFLQRHRKYDELDLLPRSYPSRNILFSLIKRLQGRSSPDRYFRKLEEFEPESGFYRDF